MSCSITAGAAVRVVIKTQQSCWTGEGQLSCFWVDPTSKPSQTVIQLPAAPSTAGTLANYWQIWFSGHLSYFQVTYHTQSVTSVEADYLKKKKLPIAFPPLFFPTCINGVRMREKLSAEKAPQISPWFCHSWAQEQLVLPQPAKDFPVISAKIV